jgi:hypothetical protein
MYVAFIDAATTQWDKDDVHDNMQTSPCSSMWACKQGAMFGAAFASLQGICRAILVSADCLS